MVGVAEPERIGSTFRLCGGYIANGSSEADSRDDGLRQILPAVLRSIAIGVPQDDFAIAAVFESACSVKYAVRVDGGVHSILFAAKKGRIRRRANKSGGAVGGNHQDLPVAELPKEHTVGSHFGSRVEKEKGIALGDSGDDVVEETPGGHAQIELVS